MKQLLTLVTALMLTISLHAAKATSRPTTITQSDGSTLTIIQHGDEHFNWYSTTDGVILYQEGSNYYIANTDVVGKISNSGILAHEASMRSEQEISLCKAQRAITFVEEGLSEAKSKIMRMPTDASTPKFFPHTGSPKALVLLAQFADVKFQSGYDPEDAFNQFLNSSSTPSVPDVFYQNTMTRNYGSAKSYFSTVSYGQFTPQFDVYAPVTLSKNMSVYGEGDDDMNTFVPEVCNLAHQAGVDFSKYDNDGDGYVDIVYIIFAGYGANFNGNPTNTIWPKCGISTFNGLTLDGKRIYRYGVHSELAWTAGETQRLGKPFFSIVGLFCHEFSHALGLPDLYVTSSDTQPNNQGMEDFSIMDAGEYTGNGYYPTAYTAFEREAMGWMTIKELTDAGTYRMKDLNSTSNKDEAVAYRIKNDQDPAGNEYYILENIQNTSWNKALGVNGARPHGMMITHVDFDKTAFGTFSKPNNTIGHPRITVLPANGTLYSAAIYDDYKEKMVSNLFPGTTNTTEFKYDINGYTNSIVYKGSAATMAATKPVINISEETSTGIVIFDFISPTTGIDAITNTASVDSKVYTINGQMIGTNLSSLPHGIYIIGGKKVIK